MKKMRKSCLKLFGHVQRRRENNEPVRKTELI